MNLAKLFEAQKKLDEHIEKEHPRQEGEDRLAKKILALKVELGELAQEWRGFKYWSHDQEPRIGIPSVHYDENLGHDVVEYVGPNPLLEEYVDCLHFILSIGNELIHRSDKTNTNFEKNDKDILWHFQYLFSVFADLWNFGEIDEPYGSIIKTFLDLGELLGFTYDQIEQAYLDKNKINHHRQEVGY